MGKKSADIRKILGYCYHEDVVHRDNMVIVDQEESKKIPSP